MRDNYYDSKEFRNILRQYEEARDEHHSVFLDTDALTDIAEYYLSQGLTRKASEAVEYALSLFPDANGPLILKARLLLMQYNDAHQAAEIADQIEDKDDLDYYFLQAEILIVEGRQDDADEYLEEYMEQTEGVDRKDFILDTATLFADYNEFFYARKWLLRSEETDSIDYIELRGRILYGEKCYEESEEVFARLVDEQPFSIFYWDQLAAAQYMLRRYNDSISSSEYAIAIHPGDSDALLNKANCLFALNNFEEAAAYYHRYTLENPDIEVGYLHEAECLMNSDKGADALQLLYQAEHYVREGSPFLLEIYQDLAFTLSRQGDMEKAIGYADKAMLLEGVREEMLVLKGHIYLENGHHQEAARCFMNAINDSGHSSSIMIRVGTSLFDNNYISEAYKILKPLLTTADDNWDIGYSYLAICAREMHKNDEFLHFLDIAVRKNPEEARNVLCDLFPDGMDPADYYQYALNQQQQ